MLYTKFIKNMTLVLLCGFAVQLHAAESFSIQDLSYKGASRFLDKVYGESRLGFANGTFVVDSKNNSIFIVGHNQDQALAEYRLNGFSKSDEISQLPMAEASLQVFSKILSRPEGGNPEKIDRITGMALINNQLIVNALEYYNADGNNVDTTLIIENPQDIKESVVSGYFRLKPRAHAAGWMTPIPKGLQEDFGADYIFGFAGNLPINSRNSIGPSAFAVDTSSFGSLEPHDVIKTDTLLDFSIANPLHEDLFNEGGENDLWTEVSQAYVGFIVPGTETYAVFGTSAGHEHGLGYKITQDAGNLCGGACPKVASDRYNYYWLWSIGDLLAVKQGQKAAHELRPYDYGKLVLPFEITNKITGPHLMIAAHYDRENQDLYFMLGNADTLQGPYESLPLLLAFDINDINVGSRPTPPSALKVE